MIAQFSDSKSPMKSKLQPMTEIFIVVPMNSRSSYVCFNGLENGRMAYIGFILKFKL